MNHHSPPSRAKDFCGHRLRALGALLFLFGLAAGTGQAASYFLALELPRQTQQSLINRQQYIAQFLPADTTVTWHPADNLHITLQGIDDTLNAGQLAALSTAMHQVARAADRFNLADKIVNSTYEVWDDYIVFKLKPSRTLRALGDAIYDAVSDVLPHDAKQKYFHVSIGTYTRSTDRQILKSLSVRAPACDAFPVTSFELRKSNYPDRPRRYDPIERYVYRNKATLSLRDYNADGRTDLAVFNPESGQWRFTLIPGLAGTYALRSSGADLVPVSGMFDSDALTDVGTYAEANGTWEILSSAGHYVAQPFMLGGPGFRPVPGDYDADGLTDPAVCQESEGYWKFLLSDSGYGPDEGYLGGPGCMPIPEDYDGDGETDLAVYQEAAGIWHIMLSDSDYEVASFTGGGPGWVPVPADYDGDGWADPALFNSSSGDWVASLSGSGYACASLTLGGSGWMPSPSDFDGDGLADPAVYQEASGIWQTCLSGSGYKSISGSLGGPGWIPVP